MEYNPKVLIDKNPMTGLQYSTIFICFLMNLLDGMDVMVISYTAPAIAKAWSISPQALGIVFSSGLLGMTCGALFMAPFADKIGRKSMISLSNTRTGCSMAQICGTMQWILSMNISRTSQVLKNMRTRSGCATGVFLRRMT